MGYIWGKKSCGAGFVDSPMIWTESFDVDFGVDFGWMMGWILGEFNSTCSCTPLTAGGISKQFRDLEVCFEISPAGRVSQEQVEKNSRKLFSAQKRL